MIGQRRIDKWFLPVGGFCGATTRETISVNVRLDHFGEEFGNRTQPEPVSPVPSIQRLPKLELDRIRRKGVELRLGKAA
jgi:hypothetical protein